jgi:hypothetical protein
VPHPPTRPLLLALLLGWGTIVPLLLAKKKKEKLSACRGEGSAVGLQLRVRFVPAALLAMLRTALASSVGPFGYACAPLYASEHVKQRNQGTEPTGR